MVRCSCIRGNFNFHVSQFDKNNLVYLDMSDWMTEDRYIIPDTYNIIITPPNESLKLLTVRVGIEDRIHREDVGVIKDGVWCFETESCGVKYKRSVLFTDLIECCLNRAFALDEDDEKYDELVDAEKFVKLAKSAASIGNFKDSKKFLDTAQKKLDRLKCDCDC